MGVEVLSIMEVRQKDRYSKILVNLVNKFFKTLKSQIPLSLNALDEAFMIFFLQLSVLLLD